MSWDRDDDWPHSAHQTVCGFATRPSRAALHPTDPPVFPYNFNSTSHRMKNRLGKVSGSLCLEIRGRNSASRTMGSVAVRGSESSTRASRPSVGVQGAPTIDFTSSGSLDWTASNLSDAIHFEHTTCRPNKQHVASLHQSEEDSSGPIDLRLFVCVALLRSACT